MANPGPALVVVADARLRASAADALAALECASTIVASSAEALAPLRDARPAFVIVDVDARDDTWASLSSQLAADITGAWRPIVLGLAADDGPQARLSWARRGIDRLVPRTLDSAALALALRTDLPPGYDPALVDRLRQLDPELASGALHDFLADAPRRLSALRLAFEQRNDSVLRLHAHSLKGSGSQVGTLRLALLGAAIEDLVAGEAPREQIAPKVVELEAEFQRLRACLHAEAGDVPTR